ncbi:flagellar cap protein FliD N-terminal domain-containing protein [Moritella viscosa]
MAGITMAGSGSGLDLETIITTFVTAEKTPKETRLNKKEVDLTTELSGIGTLKSGLADFKAITGQLGNVDSFYQSKTNIRYQGRNIEQATAGGDSAALPITIQTKGVVTKRCI